MKKCISTLLFLFIWIVCVFAQNTKSIIAENGVKISLTAPTSDYIIITGKDAISVYLPEITIENNKIMPFFAIGAKLADPTKPAFENMQYLRDRILQSEPGLKMYDDLSGKNNDQTTIFNIMKYTDENETEHMIVLSIYKEKGLFIIAMGDTTADTFRTEYKLFMSLLNSLRFE